MYMYVGDVSCTYEGLTRCLTNRDNSTTGKQHMERPESQKEWGKTEEKYSEKQMCTCLLTWDQQESSFFQLALAQWPS